MKELKKFTIKYWICNIHDTTDIEYIKDIIDIQEYMLSNTYYKNSIFTMLYNKDIEILNNIYDTYFNDDRYFNYEKIYNFISGDRERIKYNYHYIKFLDKIDKIDWYLEKCRKTDSFINICVLIYYYIHNNMIERAIQLIESTSNDRSYKFSIGTKRTILNKIINNNISIFNIFSNMDQFFSKNIVELLKLPLFDSLIDGNKSTILNRLHLTIDDINDIDNSVIDINKLTTSQFLKINRLDNSKNINIYVNIIKKTNFRFSESIRSIMIGLYSIKFDYELYLVYFNLLSYNNIINRNTSTDILKILIGYTEFIVDENLKNTFLEDIYLIFIKKTLNLNDIKNHIDRIKTNTIKTITSTKPQVFNYKYSKNKLERYEFTYLYLNGLNRKYKIQKLIKKEII